MAAFFKFYIVVNESLFVTLLNTAAIANKYFITLLLCQKRCANSTFTRTQDNKKPKPLRP